MSVFTCSAGSDFCYDGNHWTRYKSHFTCMQAGFVYTFSFSAQKYIFKSSYIHYQTVAVEFYVAFSYHMLFIVFLPDVLVLPNMRRKPITSFPGCCTPEWRMRFYWMGSTNQGVQTYFDPKVQTDGKSVHKPGAFELCSSKDSLLTVSSSIWHAWWEFVVFVYICAVHCGADMAILLPHGFTRDALL